MLFTPGLTVHRVQRINAFKSFSLPLDVNFFSPFLKFHITWHNNTHARARTHRCPVFHRSGGKQALYNEFMAGWWRLLVENTLFICESKGELKQFGCLLTSPEHIHRTRFSCWSVVIFSFHCLQAVYRTLIGMFDCMVDVFSFFLLFLINKTNVTLYFYSSYLTTSCDNDGRDWPPPACR